MFTRRENEPEDDSPAAVFHGLRGQILHLDPAEVGAPTGSGVWGGMMDMTYPTGAATLVCLHDGTTSLYTSTGGGILGGGAHPSVVAANDAFLTQLTLHAPAMRPDTGEALPAVGDVVLRALTHDGPRTVEATEDDLGYGRSPFSPVFHAAHAVITALREVHSPE